MESFKSFLEGQEEQNDIKKTLSRLPERHRRFLRGFTLSFQGSNTLNGDNQHVGVIQTHPRPHITIAAPWNYPREWVFLHEIAHMVYEKMMTHELRQQWAHIVAQTPNKQDQNPEELFCMAYANAYAKHKIRIHDHPEWDRFIKEMV